MDSKKFRFRNFDFIIRIRIKISQKSKNWGRVIDRFLRKNTLSDKRNGTGSSDSVCDLVPLFKNSSITWPQFFDFWLICYSESVDIVEIPKFHFFRSHRNIVWNQILATRNQFPSSFQFWNFSTAWNWWFNKSILGWRKTNHSWWVWFQGRTKIHFENGHNG